MATSGTPLMIRPGEPLHIGVNLGLVFRKELKRTKKWDSTQSIEDLVSGYFIALKLHNYEMQEQNKKDSVPWMVAMSRDNNCVASHLIGTAVYPRVAKISMAINDEEPQTEMLMQSNFMTNELIEYITSRVTINPGDILLKGSPFWNKSPLKAGDRIIGKLQYGEREIIKVQTTLESRK